MPFLGEIWLVRHSARMRHNTYTFNRAVLHISVENCWGSMKDRFRYPLSCGPDLATTRRFARSFQTPAHVPDVFPFVKWAGDRVLGHSAALIVANMLGSQRTSELTGIAVLPEARNETH